jgi:hypothetical protein
MQSAVRCAATLKLPAISWIGGYLEVKKHKLRVGAALAGASAVIAMGALSVAQGVVQTQANNVLPTHFGGPVDTTVYTPTATLGMPTSSSPSAGAPAPMSAPG